MGYKIFPIQYGGKFKAVTCHGSKCSALLAATNLSFLSANCAEVLPGEDLSTFDVESALEDLVLTLHETLADPSELSENLLQRSQGKEEILESLARSLDAPTVLDPKNSSCKDFEETDEHCLLKIFSFDVFHGSLLDPEDKDLSSVQGFSHSQMAGKIAELAEINGNDHPLVKKLNCFRKASITTHGLSNLLTEVKEGELAILYADNEYNVLYKHEGDLFTLEAAEEIKIQLGRDAVWKMLTVEEEKSFHVTGHFTPTIGQPKEKQKLGFNLGFGMMHMRNSDICIQNL